jgi:hypothetical protein
MPRELATATCRVCDGNVHEFLDLGRQPLSDAFREPDSDATEFFFRLAVGQCESCTMVQLTESVPREKMFHEDYPYHSSGSAVMREHFASVARRFLATELAVPDPFIVEMGCNDGVMLSTIHRAGVRHLGFEPSGSRVVAYGATAKSATVTNFCDIGPELVSYVCDSTPAKQHRMTPGKHIPVRPPTAFRDPYPDYALLFAWNHADEIMANEQEFRRSGGRWISYVPNVRVL